MSRRLVPLTLRLSTLRGLVMQPELMKGLGSLDCSGEGCSLLVAENEMGGFVVSLKCSKSMLTEEPWSVDHNPDDGAYTYRAVFNTETSPVMIDSVKRLLSMPDIAGESEATWG